MTPAQIARELDVAAWRATQKRLLGRSPRWRAYLALAAYLVIGSVVILAAATYALR